MVVTADIDNAVAELNESNNTRISVAPIVVRPSFTAVVHAELPGKSAPAGTPVRLVGSVTMLNGQSPVGRLVNLHLTLREFHRVVSVVVQHPDGSFETMFHPLPGEAGHYTVGAASAGEGTAAAQDEFTLYGARFDPSAVAVRVDEGSSVVGRVKLVNLSEVPLTGLTISEASSVCTMNWSPVSAAAAEPAMR